MNNELNLAIVNKLFLAEKNNLLLQFEEKRAYSEWKKFIKITSEEYNININKINLESIFPKPSKNIPDNEIQYNEAGDPLNQSEEFSPPNKFDFSDVNFRWLEDEKLRKELIDNKIYKEKVFRGIGDMPIEVKKQIELHGLQILGRCNNPHNWEVTRDPQQPIPDWEVTKTDVYNLESSNLKEKSSCDKLYWDNRQGLVYGMVQSGKTASMIALMGLANSAGFKLFIVLSGDKNSLRNQTQKRINDAFELTTHGWPKSGHKIRSFTQLREDYTESTGGNGVGDFYDSFKNNESIIICLKKNSSNLKTLIDDIKAVKVNVNHNVPNFNFETDLKTLIIDDEADYASQNTKVGKQDPSAINEYITQIRNELPQNTYVAYTATPQACLGADTTALVGYPKHFIWLLDPFRDEKGSTTTYLGLQEFFTSDYSNELIYELDDKAWPHWEKNERGIRQGIYNANGSVIESNLKKEEKQAIKKFIDDSSFREEYGKQYKKAITDFLITCAIRWYRHYIKQKQQGYFSDKIPSEKEIELPSINSEGKTKDGYKSFPYHAMMFNLAYITEVQFDLLELVEIFFNKISEDFKNTKKHHWNETKSKFFTNQYEKQASKTIYFEKPTLPGSKILEPFIKHAISISKKIIHGSDKWIYVLNSKDEGEILRYNSNIPENRPKKASIIIGGHILGRGLTIENLSTSVFVRSQALSLGDTNLQMCRWFGHKKKDIDLQSVYMQKHSKELFECIGDADKDLRSQFKEYLYKNTPAHCILLQLQNSPLFRVTSPTKSKFLGKGSKSSYSGKTVLLTEPKKHLNYIDNDDKLTEFLKNKSHKLMNNRAKVYFNIDINKFRNFFKTLNINDKAMFVTPTDYDIYLKDWFGKFKTLPSVNIAVFGHEKYVKRKQESDGESYRRFIGGKSDPNNSKKYIGDIFVDKEKEFHELNYDKKYFNSRQMGDPILVSFYRLNSRYISKGNPDNDVDKGALEKPILTYAISTPNGGPLYATYKNKQIILDDNTCNDFNDNLNNEN